MTVPDTKGKFGPYRGQFVPETLMPALEELIAAYDEASNDPDFMPSFIICYKVMWDGRLPSPMPND